MAKKKKITVWMSTDCKFCYYDFWGKKPHYSKYANYGGGGYTLGHSKKGKVAHYCRQRANLVLNPIKLEERGLYKLTITAKRIE